MGPQIIQSQIAIRFGFARVYLDLPSDKTYGLSILSGEVAFTIASVMIPDDWGIHYFEVKKRKNLIVPSRNYLPIINMTALTQPCL